jgi:hypothetical protein
MWWHMVMDGQGEWRGHWQMEWVASTLHTTLEYGVSSITTADAHTSAASSRLSWRPRRFKWAHLFRQKTKYGFCACAITFQKRSTRNSEWTPHPSPMKSPLYVQYLQNRMVGGPQNWCFGEKKNFSLFPGIEARFLDCPAHSLVIYWLHQPTSRIVRTGAVWPQQGSWWTVRQNTFYILNIKQWNMTGIHQNI